MSRYHHNKVTHELEPIAGYGSRVATSIDGKTLTVHSSILNIDGYNYGEGDISTAVQMIAPIESSLVASKAYAKGDQFVYNGLLYKATAAIASGGAIVIGTNASLADSVSEQIQSLTNKVVKTPFTWYDVTSSAVTFLNTSNIESNSIRVYSNGIDCIIRGEYRLSSNPQAISGGWIPSLDNIRINSAYTPQYEAPLHGFFADVNHSPIFWQALPSGYIVGFTGSSLTSISRIPIYGRWTIHG